MGNDVIAKLSLKQFILILGAISAVMGIGTAALGYVYATQADLGALEKRTKPVLTEWRLQTLETRTQNLEARTARADTNIVLLLERFRVTPAPEPVYAPLPEPPKGDNDAAHKVP